MEARKSGDMPLCVQKDQASLALENHPYVRLHIAGCLASVGRLKDALVAARDALAASIKTEDEDLKKAALTRVQELLPRLSHLKLELPEKTESLKVTINGQLLRDSQVRDKLTLDPGDYTIEALREENGEKYVFKEKVTIAEGEDRTVEVLPKRDHLPTEVELCLKNAKNYQARLACIEERPARPNVRVAIEMSGYTDSTDVHVLTPAMSAAVVSPTSGWSVGGSYLLDMVTAASPDLVSTASRAFVERRHAGSLNGGYKLPFAQFGVNGNVSSEPDYLSRMVGGAISKELNEKLITPRIGYSYSWDTIGYRDTSFRNLQRMLVTHAIDAGVTFVMSPTTLLVTGVSMTFERGENAKLYRFIPMFPEDIVEKIPPGSSARLVNDNRLDARPRELVPQQRDRFAVGARVNHRLSTGTIRAEERFYVDNWGIKASTTDLRYLQDLGERVRIGPHARFHVQSGATFYQLAYAARQDSEGTPVSIPRYRTADREASPMLAITLGGTARLGLTSEKSTPSYAILVSGDVMYNKYFQALYVLGRTAVWGTLSFEAEF